MVNPCEFVNATISHRDESHASTLPIKCLITPRRLDIAVKFRFFRSLHGGCDTGAERVYRWHIEKRIAPRMEAGLPTDVWKGSLDDYVQAATALYESMVEKGFDPAHAIPIDPNGELLGGAHRLACAAALEIDRVPIDEKPNFAWAPPWGEAWFVSNDMHPHDRMRMMADWGELHGRSAGRKPDRGDTGGTA